MPSPIFPIPADLTLIGLKVKLIPMTLTHLPALIAAGQDPRIWQYYSFDGLILARMERFVLETLAEKAAGTKFPFVMIDVANNEVIGTTSLYEFSMHRNLEIGHTWMSPTHWGQGYNEESKLLLLTYCFEVLGLIRVHFKVWDQNLRSQAALRRVGAQFEGYTRRHIIREDGIVRTSAIFSILDDEWVEVKRGLEGMLVKV